MAFINYFIETDISSYITGLFKLYQKNRVLSIILAHIQRQNKLFIAIVLFEDIVLLVFSEY